MDENGMTFSDTQVKLLSTNSDSYKVIPNFYLKIDDLTRAMFEDADPDNRGGVSYINKSL